MSISKVQTYDLYLADGTNDTFPVTINFLNTSTNLKVYIVDANNQETLETHWTLSADNEIVFSSSYIPEDGEKVKIIFDGNLLQSEDFPRNAVFPTSEFTSAIDKLTLTNQQILTELDSTFIEPLAGANSNEIASMALQEASAVTITGGSISGITDLAIADGGFGASTASGARTNLELGTMATQNSDAVTITGGSISGSTIGITASTEDTTPDQSNDFILSYEASSTTVKKVKISNLPLPTFVLENDTAPTLSNNLQLNGYDIDFPSASINDISYEPSMSSDSSSFASSQAEVKVYTDNSLANIASNGVYYVYFSASFTFSMGSITRYVSLGYSNTTANTAGATIIFPHTGVLEVKGISYINDSGADHDIDYAVFGNGTIGTTAQSVLATGGVLNSNSLASASKTITAGQTAEIRIRIDGSSIAESNGYGNVRVVFKCSFNPS